MSSTTSLSLKSGIRSVLTMAAIVCGVILCLPTAIRALPVKDVIGQATMAARREQQHREKRAVTTSPCEPPADLEAMFQRINSQLGVTQFLQRAPNNQSVHVPESETGEVVISDPNESTTCPSSLTTDNSAPLAHRSLCPYYFTLRRLPQGYYPSTVRWANCKCVQCIQNNAYGCEPVMTSIAVLRPVGCFQGMQKYEERMVQVPTSCACAANGPTDVPDLDFGVSR